MKILKEEVKECKNSKWEDEKVLIIQYSYKKNTWEVNIREYNPDLYTETLKALRKEIKKLYNLTYWLWN